jgi:hypothetical protein
MPCPGPRGSSRRQAARGEGCAPAMGPVRCMASTPSIRLTTGGRTSRARRSCREPSPLVPVHGVAARPCSHPVTQPKRFLTAPLKRICEWALNLGRFRMRSASRASAETGTRTGPLLTFTPRPRVMTGTPRGRSISGRPNGRGDGPGRAEGGRGADGDPGAAFNAVPGRRGDDRGVRAAQGGALQGHEVGLDQQAGAGDIRQGPVEEKGDGLRGVEVVPGPLQQDFSHRRPGAGPWR